MRFTALRHPVHARLAAWAAADLDAEARRRVSAHLLTCAECRHEVQELVALLDEARRAPAARAAAADCAVFVTRRRAAGERVILPPDDHAPVRASRVRTRYVGAAAAAVIVGTVLIGVPPVARAGSTSGELTFSAAARPGETVRVEYRAGARHADEAVLTLRGRFRTGEAALDAPSSEPHAVARLVAAGSGRYMAEFVFPPDAVYGIFAVEDAAARHVDTNLGRYWQLHAAGADGQPSFDALRAQWLELQRNSFARAYDVLRTTAATHGTRPELMAQLALFDNTLLSDAEADSALVYHRQRMLALHATLQRTERLADEELGGMLRYSRLTGDSARHAYWRRRVLAEAPNSRVAVQQRIATAFAAHWQTDPAAALDSVDALWRGTRNERALLAQQGFILARRLGDPALIRTWGERSMSATPAGATAVALAFAALAELRPLALTYLDSLVNDGGLVRPLGTSAAEHAEAQRGARAIRLAAYGRALLMAGDTAGAAASLAEAAEQSWSASVFEAALTAMRPIGHPLTQTLEAWLAVDPGSSDAAREVTIERQVLDRARAEMRRRTLRTASSRVLPGDARLRTPKGVTVSLRDVLTEPAVIVLVSRYCGYSIEELPELAVFARRIRAIGVPIIAVTTDSPADRLRAMFDAHGIDVPLYQDFRGEVNDALESWETPTYYVTDGAGRVRFAKSMRADIPRQLDALRSEITP